MPKTSSLQGIGTNPGIGADMRERLSKDICRECHRKQQENPYHSRGSVWDPFDESQWEDLHTVICDGDDSGENPPPYKTASTLDAPPDWCPYRFQHAIRVGQKDE
jgi:hypothetical protein